MMEHYDVGVKLKEAAASGLALTVLLDPLADPDMVTRFFAETVDADYANLFSNTSFEYLHTQGPYLFALNEATKDFFEGPLGGGLACGAVIAGVDNFHIAVRHWQSLLHVLRPDGTLSHLRFYDADIFSRLLGALPKGELSAFLGPHAFAFSSGRNADEEFPTWKYAEHGHFGTHGAQYVSDHYDLRAAPWWEFKEEYWYAFRDKIFNIRVANIVEKLFSEFPAQTAGVNTGSGVETFVAAHLNRAQTLGLDDATLDDFVTCCLLYGENFPQGTRLDPALPGNERLDLAHQLAELIKEAPV